MRAHPRHCDHKLRGAICPDEHIYYCADAGCGNDIVADESTHFKAPNGVILPNGYWPFCSLECYSLHYGDSDPNGFVTPIDDEELELAPEEPAPTPAELQKEKEEAAA